MEVEVVLMKKIKFKWKSSASELLRKLLLSVEFSVVVDLSYLNRFIHGAFAVKYVEGRIMFLFVYKTKQSSVWGKHAQ